MKTFIGGISKWEIVAVTVKFFGSLSYSYYFSVAVVITIVALVTMAVANFL